MYDLKPNNQLRRKVGLTELCVLSVGGCNLSFWLFGMLFTAQNSAAVPILFLSFLTGLLVAPGWLELVLMYPTRVGGIAPAAALALRPYSEVLGTIIGIAYAGAWFLPSSFAAIFFANIIQQLFSLSISTALLANLLILIITFICLSGLQRSARIFLPIALIAIIITVLSVVVPVLAGKVNWTQAFTFHLTVPFPGWFGQVTSIMAGFYLAYWTTAAFECSLCYVAETVEPSKTMPRVLWLTVLLTGFFCSLVPLFWYGVLGVSSLKKDIITVYDMTMLFGPLGGTVASFLGIAFLLFNTLLSTLTPLCNVPRTLAQLADDGFIPKLFSKRILSSDVPWIALIITSGAAILAVTMESPTWFIAATNFDYLICISVTSIAVILLRYREPMAERLYKAPRIMIFMMPLAAAIWILVTILGFEQYGLPAVVAGIAYAFGGALFLVARKIADAEYKGISWLKSSMHSLQFKLTGTMLLVLSIDSLGYLIAVNTVAKFEMYKELTTILEDIFVLVAILTISIGLIVPGVVVEAAKHIAMAAQQLVKGTLKDFSKAMLALGKGELEKANARVIINKVPIESSDEIGKMAESFNLMQDEVVLAAKGLDGARDGLIQARRKLLEANETLEMRVKERTADLQRTLDNLTITKGKFVESEKLALMSRKISGIVHEVSTPIGIAVTGISLLQEAAHKIQKAFYDKTLTPADFETYCNSNIELINIIFSNLRRSTSLMQGFKEISADNITEIKRKFKLKEYLEDIILNMKPELKKTKINVSIDCPNDLEVDTYPSSLFQVITILVINSLTHAFDPGDEGVININVTTVAKDIVLKYADSGKGIPPENIKKIFDPFFTTRRGKGNIGLGLNIAHEKIVKLLKGTISCESVLSKGSIFTITFPRNLS